MKSGTNKFMYEDEVKILDQAVSNQRRSDRVAAGEEIKKLNNWKGTR